MTLPLYTSLLLLAEPSASVVEAQLIKVEDISGQAGAPCICDENGSALFDGSFRLFFSPVRHVAGPTVGSLPSFDQASAQPIEGRNYLLVVAHPESGDEIIWKGSVANGLCLEPEEIKAHALDEVARMLPCKD